MWTNRKSTHKIAPGRQKYDLVVLNVEEILTAQGICPVRSRQMYLKILMGPFQLETFCDTMTYCWDYFPYKISMI